MRVVKVELPNIYSSCSSVWVNYSQNVPYITPLIILEAFIAIEAIY